MPDYASNITRADKENIILYHQEIGAELSLVNPRINNPEYAGPGIVSWVQHVTYTNVWYSSFLVSLGSIPYEVVRVSIGKYAATQVYSLQACQSTDSSFYFDSRAGILYVNPNTLIAGASDDPRQEIVIAWIKLRFSNKLLYIDDYAYDPRIVNRSAAEQIRIGVKDFLFSDPFLTGGNIQLFNGDRFLDRNFYDYEWIMGIGEIYHGFKLSSSDSLSLSDFRKVRQVTCSGFKRNDRVADIFFRQVTFRTEVDLLQMSYELTADSDYPNQSAYPNMDESEEGTLQPLFFGKNDDNLAGIANQIVKRGIRATLVDKGTDPESDGVWVGRKYKWMAELTDPETGSKYGGEVTRVYKVVGDSVQKINSSNYTTADNGTQVNFANNYGIEEGAEIYILGKGYSDKAAGKFTGTASALISKPQDIAHFVMVVLCGIKTAEINIASFAAVGVNTKKDETGANVTGTMVKPSYYDDVVHFEANQVKGTQFINMLCLQLRAAISTDTNGKITQTLYDSVQTNSDIYLNDSQFGEFTDGRSIDELFARIVVEFFPNVYKESHNNLDDGVKRRKKRRKKKNTKTRTVSSIAVNDSYAEALGIEKELRIITSMKTDTKAKLLCDSWYETIKRGLIMIETADIVGVMLLALPQQRTLLIRNRGIGGSYYEKTSHPLEMGGNLGSSQVGLSLMAIA